MKWIRLTEAGNIPPREGRAVNAGGQEIAVFNLGERYVAVGNRCPHRGGPLADGIVSGNTVVCPLHAWKVCLDDGAVTKPERSACVETFPVKVEDGIVCIALAEREVAA